MNTDFAIKVLKEFIRLKGFKLSASLAFFTFFSLPSLMILLISAGGYFFGKKDVESKLVWQIKSWIGTEAALSIQKILGTVSISNGNNISNWFALALLTMASAGIFAEIKDSLQTIWETKPIQFNSWGKWFMNRILSFLLIIATGGILVISLTINYIFSAFGYSIDDFMPRTTKFILDFANYLSTFTVLLGVATCIFKFLPQANISWRNALDGALVSSALFVIGKFIVSFYISFNPIFSAYTATSSLILLLAWVYYSSIVLYIGALVTKLLNKKFEKSTTNAVSKSVATSTVSTPTASKYKNRIVNK